MTARGLPHSDIQGSSLLSSYSWLFAAWYVLHRLWSQGIHLVLLLIFDSYYFRLLEIASATDTERSAADRFHVWHMKVLLYAVFKDREGSNDIAHASRRTALLRKTGKARATNSWRVRSLKAERCSTLTVNPRYKRAAHLRSDGNGESIRRLSEKRP